MTKMRLQAVIFTVAVAFTALCNGAAVPVEETDVQLTASDADSGNWTANLGDVQVNIEHEHGLTTNASGSWTLGIARTAFDKEEDYTPDNVHEEDTEFNRPKDLTYEQPAMADIDYSYKPSMETEKFDKDTSEDEHMNNIIPVDDYYGKNYNNPMSFPFSNFKPVPLRFDYPPSPPVPYYDLVPPPPPPPQQVMYPPPPPPQYGMIPPPNYQLYFDRDVIVTDEPSTQYYGEAEEQKGGYTDPDDFEYFEGVGWFKLDDRTMNWEEARDACSAVGAHLAVPDTQERVQVFLKLFQKYPDIPKNAVLTSQVYVGVNDPLKKREFTTVEGKPFNPGFPIWFVNEPDNAAPGEDCVTFHTERRTRDVPCFYGLPFICEKNVSVLI